MRNVFSGSFADNEEKCDLDHFKKD